VDLSKKIQELSLKYSKDVNVISIYIREFHAKEGWQLPQSTTCYMQPTTIEARAKIASDFLSKNSPKNVLNLWLDTMDNKNAIYFKAEPERLFITKNKKIVYVGGEGPFGYDPWLVEEWLMKELGY